MQSSLPLAASYDTDPAVFKPGRDTIFDKTWQCVCHVSASAKPGDVATHAIVDEGIIVIRGRHK